LVECGSADQMYCPRIPVAVRGEVYTNRMSFGAGLPRESLDAGDDIRSNTHSAFGLEICL
jgi:hypothetical protein